MGILLTFMFLWNMLGALIGIPALSYFLLSDPKVSAAEEHSQSSESVSEEAREGQNAAQCVPATSQVPASELPL
jgi:hypothetical protein